MKVVDWLTVWVAVAVILFVLVALSFADVLDFNCTGDPLATGYRLKTKTSFGATNWTVLAESPTCAFAVQRPAVNTLFNVCAFNATTETCRDTTGYFSYPVPTPLAVGSTGLQ